jgi:hypothetical protein
LLISRSDVWDVKWTLLQSCACLRFGRSD